MIEVTLSKDQFRQIQVVVNGKPWRKMAASLFKSSTFGTFASLSEFELAWEEWEVKRLKSMAYYKLSKRRYFAEELQKSLLEYGFLPKYIDKILEELQSYGYLNDEDGLESLIQASVRARKSPLWIRYKLMEKGMKVPENFDDYYPEEQRKANIRALFVKNTKDKKKAIASLVRKGFSLQEVISVIN